MIKKTVVVLGLFFCVASCATKQNRTTGIPSRQRSVIKLTIDGGGVNQLQFLIDYYRWKYKKASNIEQMIQDGSVALVDVRGATGTVPDSAQTATQLELGEPTYNEVVGISASGVTRNHAEVALEQGFSVGNISNRSITDATPAAVLAHRMWRKDEALIAEDIAASKATIVFGGGHSFFIPRSVKGSKRKDEKDLIASMKEQGKRVIHSVSEFRSLPSEVDAPIVGLFAQTDLQNAFSEPTDEPSLEALLEKTLSLLEKNQKGFYLAVEEGKTDNAAHANDVGWMLRQLLQADRLVGLIRSFQKKHPEVTFFVTADHETGGFHVIYDTMTAKQTVESEQFSIKGFGVSRPSQDYMRNGHVYAFVDVQKREYQKILEEGRGHWKKLAALIRKDIHSSADFEKIPGGIKWLKWMAFAPYLHPTDEKEVVEGFGATGRIQMLSLNQFREAVKVATQETLSEQEAMDIMLMEQVLLNASRKGDSNRLFIALKDTGLLNASFVSSGHTSTPVFVIGTGEGAQFSRTMIRQMDLGKRIRQLLTGDGQ